MLHRPVFHPFFRHPLPMSDQPPAPLANPRRRLPETLRRIVSGACFSYAICLTLLFLAMELIGERWWPLALMLYLPQCIFLLPLIVLIPAALLAEVPLGAY